MKRINFMADQEGNRYDIADDQLTEFKNDFGGTATQMHRFRGADGFEYNVPESDLGQFSASVPDAQRITTMQMADGSRRDFTDSDLSKYLRSKEYRESADYTPPEQGSAVWAGLKGGIAGAAEGAYEGGKAGLAKAAWALPQVGTGLVRAAGNLANGLGNGQNAVGNALTGAANAADNWMEQTMPTSTAERLGYEDWGTKTGDFFGNVAGMAVKFAPAGGVSLGAKIFTEAMLASDGINAMSDTVRTADANGMDAASANALGVMSGLVNYLGGKMLLKSGGAVKGVKNPIIRELLAAGMSGGVMGVQGAANEAIGQATANDGTGMDWGKVGMAGLEGAAEGAAFHGANMIPRMPGLVKETKAYRNEVRDWFMDSASTDTGRGFLNDVLDPEALDSAIAARKNGEGISRTMGKELGLPKNMSADERSALVDSIIAYREGKMAAEESAKAAADKAVADDAEARTTDRLRGFKDAQERAAAEQNFQMRKDAQTMAEDIPPEQPTNFNDGRGVNADKLQQTADQYAKEDAAGRESYEAWRKKNAKKDTEANRLDWFQNHYIAKENPLTARSEDYEIPDVLPKDPKMATAKPEGIAGEVEAPMAKDITASAEAKPIGIGGEPEIPEVRSGPRTPEAEEIARGVAEAPATDSTPTSNKSGMAKEAPAEPAAEAKTGSDKSKPQEQSKEVPPKEATGATAEVVEKPVSSAVNDTTTEAVVPEATSVNKPVKSMTREEAESHLKGLLEKAKVAESAHRNAIDNGAKPGSAEYESTSKAAEVAAVEYESAKAEAKKKFKLKIGGGEDIEGRRPDGLSGSLLDRNIGVIGEKKPLSKKPDIGAAKNALKKAQDDALARLATADTPTLQDERAGLIEANGKKPSKSLEKKIADIEAELNKRGAPLEQRTEEQRMEDLRSDESVKAFAKKNGRALVDGKASPGTVRDYLRQQVKKAVRATKRIFKDAEVEIKDREWNAELDGEDDVTIRSSEGRVVGTFDPATKKVTLYRGADEKTVFHELIGHGVEDWAKRNNTPLHEKLMELARTAPAEIADDVRRRYPTADEATIAKEIIAKFAEVKGTDAIKLRDAPKTWYAKAYSAVRDAIMGFIEKMGGNRVDLSKIEDMTPLEAMEHLMKEIGKGKTLGEIGASAAGANMGRGEKWSNTFFDKNTSIYKEDKEAGDAKTLQPGREAAFQATVYNPAQKEFKAILKKGNASVNEVDEYMKAIAVAERNARLAAENPDVPRDTWGGLSPKDVADTQKFFDDMERTNPEHFKAIKDAADFAWKKQREGVEERVRAGLMSRKEADDMMNAEPNHVPLKSAIGEDGEFIPWNRGMSGPEFIESEGRLSESGSPTAFIFQEFADAHMRAIENDTRKVLAAAIGRKPTIGTISTNPTLKESKVKGDGGADNVVSFKEVVDVLDKDGNPTGDKKSVVRNIILNGERGKAIASAYTNRDLMNKSPLLKKAQAFMRFWASTATEWSPTFAVRNTFADNVDLGAVVLAEKGFKEGGKWLKDYVKSRASVAKEVMKFAWSGEVADGSVLKKYIDEGGLIGGFQREGYGELVEKFSPQAIEKELKSGKNKASVIAGAVPKAVMALNFYAELMTRVAAFKTNLDANMSPKEAALWSRRISVDFNRRGNATPITNTLFMFSNSTIGATMRQLQAANTAWKTPQGKRALLGLAAFGVAEAALEHFLNMDDEERAKKGEATGKDINEHTRKTSLYLRFGGHMLRAPIHEDPLMKLVYVANATTRMAIGDMKKKDYLVEVGAGALEDIPRFFGQGSKTFEAGWNTWMPTALQPLVQHMENRDYAGRQIVRPKYNQAMPNSQNGRKSTPASFKAIAEGLNELTGGGRGRKGAIDISPETIKLGWESIAKNIGKDLANAAETGWKILTGDFSGLDSRNAPVVRDVLRKTEGNDNRYFEAVRAYDADKLEFDTRTKEKAWEEGEKRKYREERPWLKKGFSKSTRVDKLINGYTVGDSHVYGINELRRMENGERRVRLASGWTWRPKEWTEDQIADFRRRRLEKQAKVIELMGRQ